MVLGGTGSRPNKTLLNRPSITWKTSLEGQANGTIEGNTTLIGLSNGPHKLVVYAKDMTLNTTSEIVYFTIAKQSENFATWVVILIAVIIIVIGGATVIIYLKNSRKTDKKRVDFTSAFKLFR